MGARDRACREPGWARRPWRRWRAGRDGTGSARRRRRRRRQRQWPARWLKRPDQDPGGFGALGNPRARGAGSSLCALRGAGAPGRPDTMNYLNVLAKALYDNVAESPDELSFRKGDIMTVLERDTQGLDGWWLCSLHGRQGIVPGNRLKILVGMHDKKPVGPGPGPPASSALPQPSLHPPAAQYTPMLPATYQPQPDSVYLVPTPSKTQQGLYQAPGPSPQFQSPPAKQTATFSKQMPHHPFPSPAPDLYQVPPGPGSPAQDIYQVPPSAGIGHDIYQVPPSMDARSWEGTKPPAKVAVSTRVGQGYVFEAPQPEQDEYDIPRHLLAPGPQDIYDVPPVRGLLPSQYGQEVYDTPPMAVKGPNGRDPSLDVYDVPPSVEKGLPPSSHHAVYDVPPSVSKDVPDGPLLREETYDVPPAFAKAKPFDPTRHPLVLAAPPPDSPPAEDVYDVPPPAPDLYDVPPGLRRPGPGTLYDVPRERVLPPEAANGSVADDGVYAVPPPAEREAPADTKRLSASSTGSTRSSQSASSLEAAVPGREPLELEVAVEALARLQQGVSATVAHLLDLAGSAGGCGGWRSTSEPQEPPAQDLRAAVAAVHGAVHELLEFARSAVGNAAHTSDRTLHAKLSRQLQKMEDVYQTLVAHGQALDSSRGGLGATPEDLDRLVACSRAVPEDVKQLASFLHGNASLLFRRTKASVPGPEGGGPLHLNPTDKASSIQSRPLPSPPKFTSQDSPDGQYENSEGGWMEDYDYVHLQLKQFERLEQEVSRPIDHDLANWMPAQPLAPGRTGGLGPSDRQLLLFYLEQCEANLTTLTNAVDAFFTAVATNQPPKIFVAHSKFVILSAHKLVFIGDTLSRQAKAADVRSQVTHYSNLLCDLLRGIVATTKAAALQYPSPAAAQDMVDRVKELGHSTQQFRRVLGQLAAA
ncbi:breast cancer anti-estrogen resistance protein 1 isoform X2 [Sagmatias obliquidens]|uniref:breast cancer anti-estrogen resistance protein 1 isoform X2 n=1 Tax=Sagmatias obliquidens TaxID=3371155 RepID=UPI000F441E05|nr:breast cancer anti-estrogen resistance protein 1 isoform X2 [Lagenorhynchus obliquidens]